MFGRLELRFTKTLCYLTLNGNTESRAYKVLAKDSSSVATVVDDETPGKRHISHIQLVGSHFWIHVSTGVFREFFRKLEPPNKRPHPAASRRGQTIRRSAPSRRGR
jgi:hypothetical protein